MQQSTGACMYCGQTQMISHEGDISEKELDKMATKRCTCDSAVKASQAEAYKETAIDNIEHLFGTDYPEVAAILKGSVMSLINGEIREISINTGKRVKANLTVTAKGNVKVKRSENKESVLEG